MTSNKQKNLSNGDKIVKKLLELESYSRLNIDSVKEIGVIRNIRFSVKWSLMLENNNSTLFFYWREGIFGESYHHSIGIYSEKEKVGVGSNVSKHYGRMLVNKIAEHIQALKNKKEEEYNSKQQELMNKALEYMESL